MTVSGARALTLAGRRCYGSQGMSDALDMVEVVRQFGSYIPFNHFLGIEPLEVAPGHVRFTLPFRPEFIGDPRRQALHGGVTAVLIDAAGGAAVWTLVTLYQRVSTIDMRVDYLAPGRLEPLVAEARVQRKGSQVAVVNIRVYHPATPAETVADGKAVYSIRPVSASPRPSPPAKEDGG